MYEIGRLGNVARQLACARVFCCHTSLRAVPVCREGVKLSYEFKIFQIAAIVGQTKDMVSCVKAMLHSDRKEIVSNNLCGISRQYSRSVFSSSLPLDQRFNHICSICSESLILLDILASYIIRSCRTTED